jgi:hypothetical protein
MNSILLSSLDEGGDLRDDIELFKEYYLVPEAVWNQLMEWGVFSVDCDIVTVLTPMNQ